VVGNLIVNREEHLLVCLAEECAEVIQQVSKTLRFGMEDTSPELPVEQAQTNKERLVAEITDLLAVLGLLEGQGIIELPKDPLKFQAKMARVMKYLEHAERTGALQK
jgi:NTP pyrophosphatase (non-canonical NTP hydrolase)